jgi:hypothetical protein
MRHAMRIGNTTRPKNIIADIAFDPEAGLSNM